MVGRRRKSGKVHQEAGVEGLMGTVKVRKR